MEIAAARAIAATIPEDELAADYIVPSVFNRKVVSAVAEAVGAAYTGSSATSASSPRTPAPAT
jgi:malate dehydrogenase (oxaloacetate-decarboxylating)